MSEVELIALAVLSLSLYSAWQAFCRARALTDTPTAKIRSAPRGYVELTGRAEVMDGDPIIAPLSGLPCVWYRYRVEERNERGQWQTLIKEVSDSPFWLVDDTGRCVLDPDGAEVIKTTRDVWYDDGGSPRRLTGMEHDLPRWLDALRGMGARYRYTEQHILPGEELHVLGLLRTEGAAGEASNTHRELARVLEGWKRDPRRRTLFDSDGDGRIDAAEWEAARLATRRQVQRAQLARAARRDVHLLCNPRNSNRPFLISAVSEQRLARKFRRRTTVSLIAALLAAGYLAWALGHG